MHNDFAMHKRVLRRRVLLREYLQSNVCGLLDGLDRRDERVVSTDPEWYRSG